MLHYFFLYCLRDSLQARWQTEPHDMGDEWKKEGFHMATGAEPDLTKRRGRTKTLQLCQCEQRKTQEKGRRDSEGKIEPNLTWPANEMQVQ